MEKKANNQEEVVGVELKHAKVVPTGQLTDRAKNLTINGGKVKRYVYIFAEKPDGTVLNKITQPLPTAKVFYFLNGTLKSF
jgi:hypothetical protein